MVDFAKGFSTDTLIFRETIGKWTLFLMRNTTAAMKISCFNAFKPHYQSASFDLYFRICHKAVFKVEQFSKIRFLTANIIILIRKYRHENFVDSFDTKFFECIGVWFYLKHQPRSWHPFDSSCQNFGAKFKIQNKNGCQLRGWRYR